MDGSHFVVTAELSFDDAQIPTHALVDCGATGYAFIDEDFARQQNIPLTKLKTPRTLEVIDGRPVESGEVTYIAKTHMRIGTHHEEILMFVTKLGHYPVVLGLPWMKRHDVSVRFVKGTLTFDSDFCLDHCCNTAATVKAVSTPLPERINIAMIAGSTFSCLAKKSKQVDSVFKLTIHAIDKALRPEDEDILEDSKIKELVPEEYHDYLPLFKKAAASVLPPHRPYDHTIPLKDGFAPPFGPLYSLSKPELQALRKWLDENLSKGFIRASSSPASAPILFVKKKDGSLRLCVDYRGLNEGTIKNRYPLPLIHETLLQLSKARYYTTLYVRGAYNLL